MGTVEAALGPIFLFLLWLPLRECVRLKFFGHEKPRLLSHSETLSDRLPPCSDAYMVAPQ